MSTLVAGDKRHIAFNINTTDVAANTAQYLHCPFDGYILEILTAVQAVVTTGGTIKVQTATAANLSDLKDVTGATVTVANGAVAGIRATGKATGTQANIKVSKGDLIKIVPASFATAGAISGLVTINTSIDVRKATGY